VVVLAGLLVATSGFFAGHALASDWTGAEATVGRAQASSLHNLFYDTGSSLVTWGWTGTACLVAVLAVVAGILAVVLPADDRDAQSAGLGRS